MCSSYIKILLQYAMTFFFLSLMHPFFMALSKDLDTRPKKSVLRIGLVTCCMVGLEFTCTISIIYRIHKSGCY